MSCFYFIRKWDFLLSLTLFFSDDGRDIIIMYLEEDRHKTAYCEYTVNILHQLIFIRNAQTNHSKHGNYTTHLASLFLFRNLHDRLNFFMLWFGRFPGSRYLDSCYYCDFSIGFCSRCDSRILKVIPVWVNTYREIVHDKMYDLYQLQR